MDLNLINEIDKAYGISYIDKLKHSITSNHVVMYLFFFILGIIFTILTNKLIQSFSTIKQIEKVIELEEEPEDIVVSAPISVEIPKIQNEVPNDAPAVNMEPFDPFFNALYPPHSASIRSTKKLDFFDLTQ